MKNKKMNLVSRVVLIICGIALAVVMFIPIWRIDLQAPQYPEGLSMQIYANKLAGNVDIINGLNHYIGMKTLHADDFPEFTYLRWIIAIFAILFVLVAVIGKKKWLYFLLVLFIAFGVLAMVDFWRWEYDYGHNLNPAAAIIVPGMAYQPPLIGFKQLLNFGAYSIPAAGGWIFVGVGLALLVISLLEIIQGKKKNLPVNLLLIFGMALFLNSCNTKPEPIQYGKTSCDYCKMTITDNRFGGEIVTTKSKRFKFDDDHCLLSFLNDGKMKRHEVAGIYFVNFNHPHDFIDTANAHFFQSPKFNSPMNGNIAAFSNEDSLVAALQIFNGNKITWQEMQK